jgi:heme o synthase
VPTLPDSPPIALVGFGRWRDFLELTKPKVSLLIVFTAVVGMVLASPGMVPLSALLFGTVGIALASGSAAAFNHVLDRRIDEQMARTRRRPLPTGHLQKRHAVIFAGLLALASMLILGLLVNPLTAALTFCSLIGYAMVYTLWLKRATPQNIVIGGAAGAVPVLVGWAAVTNSLSWAPVVLFAIIFIWTPPHFWSLAVRYKEDYRAADVPMLPVVASMKRTTTEIVYYTVALVAVSFLFGPVAHLGWIYMISAAVLGAGFLYLVTRLWGLAQSDKATGREAMRVFGYSITYLTVLFVAMAGDVLIRNHIH